MTDGGNAKPSKSNSKPGVRRKHSFADGSYWEQRSNLRYYRYVEHMVRVVGHGARSMIDVGTGNSPYLEWFDWIPERVSVDVRVPYSSAAVKGIRGDIHELRFDEPFDICTCLQVLEHVPRAGEFAQRLLELSHLVLVSVPYMWSTHPKPTTGHVHDPVSFEKLTGWMGRQANYHVIVQEDSKGSKSKRLIAIYDRDPERRFQFDFETIDPVPAKPNDRDNEA